MWHFGDPCIHCGIRHDDVPPGSCSGDTAKAVPIAFRSLGVRHDGVEHFYVRMSNGRVEEHYCHVSFQAPYRHFRADGDIRQPPRYDPTLIRARGDADG